MTTPAADTTRYSVSVQPSGRTFTVEPGEAVLPAGIRQGQVRRLAGSLRILRLTGQKKVFQGNRDFFRKADANKTTGGNRVIVANQAYGFLGRYDLAALRCLQRLQQGMRRSWMHGVSVGEKCGVPGADVRQ